MEKYTFASNIGNISLIIKNGYVIFIELNSEEDISLKVNESTQKIIRNILKYLEGSFKTINIPYLIEGSKFQRDILNEISKIEYGVTISYKELANRAGYPHAFRACGTVCKQNHLPLVIPCHRVVKSNGLIGEYNGGVDLKKALLEMESRL